MKRKLSARIVLFGLEMMRPILLPLFWIIERVYKILFGPMALRMSKEADEQLGRDIESKLSFLFTDFGGQLYFYPIKEPSPMDYAVVKVVLPDFNLQFIRGRGDLRVRVTPKHEPKDLEDLPIILSVIDEGFERREFKSFSDLEAELKPRVKLLQEALSPDRYAELFPRLANVRSYDRAVIRQWETEINRRLYPDK